MQVAKFDVRCPQWALPKEEVPIQIKIEKTVTDDISQVVFDMPLGMRLVDTINVANHTVSGGHVVVKDINRARLSEYDYFGVVVATSEVFDDLKKELPVKAAFHMKNGSVDVLVTPVRIFRPLLEFASVPNSIALSDAKSNGQAIPIHLRFSGFGDITLRCKCTIGGRIVSHGSSLMNDVLEMIVRDKIPHIGNEHSVEADIEVDPGKVRLVAEEFKNKILSDGSIRKMMNAGKIDHDTAEMLHRLADSDKELLMGYIHRTMSTMIIGILSDIQARTLGENVQLDSKTAVILPVEIPIDELVVEFRYADVLGNEYTPIRRTIKIQDHRRAKTSIDMGMPLAIEVDESGAYKGSEVMEIGSHDR